MWYLVAKIGSNPFEVWKMNSGENALDTIGN